MFSLAKMFPREEKFYNLITELSTLAGLSARHLKTYISSQNTAEREDAAQAMKNVRDQAKRVSAETTRELCISFITPFDREDIQDFTTNLYKIPKTIDKVRQYLELHVVTSLDDLTPQVDVILQEAEAMESMVKTLIAGGKVKEVMKQAALLDKLENDGDEVLSALLVDLLKNAADAKQLILRKEIYDLLERVIDKYRNAAEVALQIALKHS